MNEKKPTRSFKLVAEKMFADSRPELVVWNQKRGHPSLIAKEFKNIPLDSRGMWFILAKWHMKEMKKLKEELMFSQYP